MPIAVDHIDGEWPIAENLGYCVNPFGYRVVGWVLVTNTLLIHWCNICACARAMCMSRQEELN